VVLTKELLYINSGEREAGHQSALCSVRGGLLRLRRGARLSAALFGTRVDHKGPRWAMFVATVCFCSGLQIAAFGVSISQSPRPRRGPPQTGGEATMTNSESTAAPPTERGPDRPVSPGLIALAWLWVVLPFTYAVWQLFAKITQLFSA